MNYMTFLAEHAPIKEKRIWESNLNLCGLVMQLNRNKPTKVNMFTI